MADNAIMARRNGSGDGGGAKIGVEFLEDYARKLNRMNFTIGQGMHWFVNKRTTPDGETQRFLDSRNAFDGDSHAERPIRSAAKALSAPRDRHPGYTD